MGAAVLLLSAVKDCNTAVHVLTIKNHCTTVCKKMQWDLQNFFENDGEKQHFPAGEDSNYSFSFSNF